MESELASLRDLDQLISQELEKVELNTEEILRLVDIREQMLQNLLPIVEGNTDLKQDAEWQAVVTRTKEIVELMQCETSQLGKQLHKLRYGQRSLQQYKKFT
ncbi:flagellar protein FliT [Vibrio rotiferianus]|jgi:flagellar rod protein FlaI|uniref:Flagellar rod protein FlaI n=1 Tax=Vibrio rotiferianus TaxID=190895 RepID=A0ABX3D7S6_9VIBR|nr:flagellar protein FliT [Vibrio rotiferianus]ASI95763.1 flagellar protein FliT [Vibrio rotiferianus]OHY92704.1 flagellar rod protein FlaI [Vibrio rotiferianus]PIB16244.1 polar flagellar rod protein FlaI [Vibrio rotiferianus CAIM 577 = LMG 21460]TMX32779.1 flagellar protein FliT [Vibrio rotiferianus]TMX52803.1 flagellar protein FliT [Vibrio rotiferianus]